MRERQIASGSAGNLAAVARVTQTFNAQNQPISVVRTNSVKGAAWTTASEGYNYFDAAGRLFKVFHFSGPTRFLAVTGVNAAGEAVYEQETYGNTPGPVVSRVYDAASQLTQASGSVTGPESYSYNATGNRGVNANIDKGNRLLRDATYEYRYDAEGNLISKKAYNPLGSHWLYAYDNANRLITAIEKQASGASNEFRVKITYAYDAFGRLVQRQQVDNGFISNQRYAYDGAHVYADVDEGRKVVNSRGSAFPVAGVVARRYLRGDSVDQIFARIETPVNGAAAVYWSITDRLGTLRQVVDDKGAEVAHMRFNSFGVPEADPKLHGRYLFTGREYDARAGLQYNRARWYDPRTGRFLSEDPIGFAGGDVNLYRYAGNSPTNATDPSGHIVPLVVGLYGAATAIIGYFATQAVISAAETAVEAGFTRGFGGEAGYSEFSWGGTFAKNFGVNVVTGGIGSKANWLGKAGAWVARQTVETSWRNAVRCLPRTGVRRVAGPQCCRQRRGRGNWPSRYRHRQARLEFIGGANGTKLRSGFLAGCVALSL